VATTISLYTQDVAHARRHAGWIDELATAMSDRVRLDKWLWAARLYKTRSLAAQAIDLGRVRIDGERIKPAREARIDDALQVQIGSVRIDVVVRIISSVRGPAAVARSLYEENAASVARRERRLEVRRLGAEPALALKGRPTKRDGRQLRQLQRERS